MLAEGALVNRKYRILAELGQGSLGLTYKALVLGSNSICAIKILDDSLVPSRISRDLVQHAVRTSSGVRDPGALGWRTVEFDSSGETILVRDYAEATSLKCLLMDGKPFPVARASRIVRQVVSVLDAADRVKVIHGDLRPENILICNPGEEEQIRLLDFGMARLKEGLSFSLHKLTMNEPGPMMGDPRYLSPEQATGLSGDSLDSRSDIYSLGLIFYQLLTGQLPCPSSSPLESLLWQALGTPPNLRECSPDLEIPEDLSRLVDLMLAKPREKRLGDARKIIEKLERIEAPHSRVPAPTVEAPQFTLLADARKTKLASKRLEQPPAGFKPSPEIDTGRESLNVPAPSASILPVGAVVIAAAQPTIGKPMRPAVPSQGRSQRSWSMAAAILTIVVAGAGVAAYHFGYRTALAGLTRASETRVQAWGHALAAGLSGSSRKIEKGAQSWSRNVKSQLAARDAAPTPKGGEPAKSAPSPARTAPAGEPSTAAAKAPSVNRVGATATSTKPAAHAPEAGRTLTAADTPPTKLSEPTQSAAAKDTPNPKASSSTGAQRARQAPRERAISARRRERARADDAAAARTVDTDIRSGDSLFELGDYDRAVDLYQQGLSLDPSNKALLDRIARAKRAKAAEAQYLNQ
jgi:serine/threonine protein kinase